LIATTTYLLLGSNLGDRAAFLQAAATRLSETEGLEIIAESPVYASQAVEVEELQPGFLNQVIKAEYQFNPSELLTVCEEIERDLGRESKSDKQPRTADIDILLFGEESIETDTLIIPHPRLLDRPFALVPLLDIDPDLVHPVTHKNLGDYLSDDDRHQIVIYQDHVSRNFTS